MTNEKEFIKYVKSKVKFNGDDCTLCDFLSYQHCDLFNELIPFRYSSDGSIRFRCDDCKKYFND
jgi:transposase-like protein